MLTFRYLGHIIYVYPILIEYHIVNEALVVAARYMGHGKTKALIL